jgi:multiple sugar transport system ATP-binding protein
MNFLNVPVAGGRGRLGALSLAAPIGEGTLLAGVRPEDFEIASPDQGVPLEVIVAEPLGAHTLLTGRYEKQQIRVIVPPDKEVAAGARIGILPALKRLVWMDPSSGRAIDRMAAE